MADMAQLVQSLTATAEVLGQQMSGPAIAVMAEDLAGYPLADVQRALTRVRRECTRFTLAAIIERLPNGWPGAEEAWATFPKDEAETGVVTREALQAWGVALPLWEDGDKIGARMAFKETYERLVAESSSFAPQWQPSLGYDVAGREDVLRRAVEQGRLSQGQAQELLPAPRDDNGPIVALLTGKASDMPQDRKTQEHLDELRRTLRGKGDKTSEGDAP